jgi:hypothetical protein
MRLISLPLLVQLVPALAFVGSGAHSAHKAHIFAFVGRASSQLFDGLSGKVFQLEEREGVYCSSTITSIVLCCSVCLCVLPSSQSSWSSQIALVIPCNSDSNSMRVFPNPATWYRALPSSHRPSHSWQQTRMWP